MKTILLLLVLSTHFCYAQIADFTGGYDTSKLVLSYNTTTTEMQAYLSSSFSGIRSLGFSVRQPTPSTTPVTGKVMRCINNPVTGSLTFNFDVTSVDPKIIYGYSVDGIETALIPGKPNNVFVNQGSTFCFFMTVNDDTISNTAGFTGTITSFTHPYSVLPIQLVDFSGTSFGQLDQLKWQTAYEQNISNFVLEHSVDGVVYTAVINIPATNKINGSKYTYSSTPIATTSYYRIKIVETNGGFTYSPVVLTTSNGIVQSKLIQFGPNPFRDAINIVFTTKKAQRVVLKLYDLFGRQIAVQSEVLQAGIQNKSLHNLGNLAPATYVLNIVGDDGIIIGNQKVMKK